MLLLIVVIYYLMRFLVARRVFSLSVRSVDGLWPGDLLPSSRGTILGPSWSWSRLNMFSWRVRMAESQAGVDSTF